MQGDEIIRFDIEDADHTEVETSAMVPKSAKEMCFEEMKLTWPRVTMGHEGIISYNKETLGSGSLGK